MLEILYEIIRHADIFVTNVWRLNPLLTRIKPKISYGEIYVIAVAIIDKAEVHLVPWRSDSHSCITIATLI